MVCGHGINDMPRGWASVNEKNQRIYKTWCNILIRCYSEKFHKTRPTYKECTICKKWLLLSNFVEDYQLIDGYEENKFMKGELCLDKDIKSNGTNKEYSLENCLWVSNTENVRQANKTRDNSYLYNRTGENNSCSIKIAQYDKKTNELIKIWNSSREIERELGIFNTNIIQCCKFWEIDCNKEKWFKAHKNHPYKSAGGYIWKYYKET